jgi:hypothetical protein
MLREGNTLETYGDGDFTFGYPSMELRAGFGGLMDASTGLLYVGNGQYYDPETGRFLTRDAKPDQSNPYVPWDPTGALLLPLGLLSAVYSRRKKGNKWGVLLAVLVFAAIGWMSISACENGQTPQVGSTIEATVRPISSRQAIVEFYVNNSPGGSMSRVV